VQFVYGWNWREAEQHLKRAIELNASNALAHDHYANLFSSLGRHAESLVESQRARDLDPFSLIIQANRGFYFYMARDFDGAIEEERKAIELDPNCYTCRTYLALAYAQKKRFSEALAEAETVKLPQASPIDIATTGCVFAGAGEERKARQLLQKLEHQRSRRFVCPYEIATTYLALGEREQALRRLEEAYRARSICMIWLAVDPRLDTLRSDRQFQDLVRRVGFTLKKQVTSIPYPQVPQLGKTSRVHSFTHLPRS
jgi:tetratricopeptide (TPR) repeat protein